MPEYALGPHVAALGLAFTGAGSTLGDGFGHGAFIARHGSWNRKPLSGYDVVFVPFDERGNPIGKPVPVLTGVPYGRRDTDPRPADLGGMGQDGALLVSDDTAGIIWRVTAPGAEPAAAIAPLGGASLRRRSASCAGRMRASTGQDYARIDQRSELELPSRAAGEFGDELPSDAARAGAAALRPFERLGLVPRQPERLGIAADDRQVIVLARRRGSRSTARSGRPAPAGRRARRAD